MKTLTAEETYWHWARNEPLSNTSVDAENVEQGPRYWERMIEAGRDAVAMRKEEIAIRSAACVQACEGMKDFDPEFRFLAYIEKTDADMKAVVAERDALRTALLALIAAQAEYETMSGSVMGIHKAHLMARAALSSSAGCMASTTTPAKSTSPGTSASSPPAQRGQREAPYLPAA